MTGAIAGDRIAAEMARWGRCVMHMQSGLWLDRILASAALALVFAAPLAAFAQDSNKLAATFTERFPAEQSSTPTPPGAAETRKEQNVARTTRVAGANRPRSRVVVVPRSFLDAGTEVLPGERKFLDYAFPPTHTPMDVVTNTGGRVGWHNSPLPGPFFPW
jgi:hypothetical protein